MKQCDQYDAENLVAARRALADPDRWPHLQEWASLVTRRLGNVVEMPAADSRGQLDLFKRAAS